MQVQFRMNMPPSVDLALLGDLPDYRVCADDTDPRGWVVIDSNGVTLGIATDLIIDLQGLIARYMVCSLEHGDARAVLIPTGFVRLEEESSSVNLDFITDDDAQKLPAFTGLPLSAEHAMQIEKVLTGKTPPATPAAKIVRRSFVRRSNTRREGA